MAEKLLLIDDDQRLAQMVGEFLRQSGYEVTHAPYAARGLTMLQEAQSQAQGQAQTQIQTQAPIDLVVLDIMLPDMDGLEVCRRIRALPAPASQTAILMLTAKGDPLDRIVGLEMGADDYLPKPFEPRELLARIRAVLRRRAQAHDTAATTATASASPAHTVLQFGSLEINAATRQVKLAGQLCDLTSYQFDLLWALAQQSGRVLSRDHIMEAVRGRELDAFDRSIDVHIGRIRQVIETDTKNPKRILTVRGVGYVFAKQQN